MTSGAQGPQVPGKLQAVYIMTICGGGWAVLMTLALVFFTFGLGLLWPGTYLEIVTAVFALVHGIKGINSKHYRIPRFVPILLIVNVINCDVVNLVLGIITLIFLKDPDVEAHLAE